MVIEGAKIFLPLAELIDFEKEIERLEKEKAKLEGGNQEGSRKAHKSGIPCKGASEPRRRRNGKERKVRGDAFFYKREDTSAKEKII